MTKSVQCACGKVLIVASGYNAEAMPFERLCSILTAVGWMCSPVLCPECQLGHTLRNLELGARR